MAGSCKVVCSDRVPPMSNEVPLFVYLYRLCINSIVIMKQVVVFHSLQLAMLKFVVGINTRNEWMTIKRIVVFVK